MLPPEQNADFVCAMEDVLEVYQRPYDPRRPVVCFDEQSKQLIREIGRPVPAAPGRPERIDYEYERNGTANLFMVFEPLAGRRRVKVTDRRTHHCEIFEMNGECYRFRESMKQKRTTKGK